MEEKIQDQGAGTRGGYEISRGTPGPEGTKAGEREPGRPGREEEDKREPGRPGREEEDKREPGRPEREEEDKREPEKKEAPSGGLTADFVRGMIFGLLLAGIAVLAFLLWRFGTLGAGEEGAGSLTSRETQEKLEQVRDLINEEALDEPDGQQLTDYLFKGVAAGLDDRYAAYYTAEEEKEVQKQNQGEYFGIGVTFAQPDGEIIVDKVREEGPAWRAGVKKGDVLLAVDGETTQGRTLSEVADQVSGAKSRVELTLSRGEETVTAAMTLENITLTDVTGKMLEQGIGYLRMTEFDEVTVEQFEESLERLREQGMEKLVVDLRDNPGGLLDAVCAILDDLLGECLIVSTQTKSGGGEKIYSDKERLFDGPMAVLANGESASAAEVFCGAVQDYGLGPVIGQKTYGKGVVQRTYRFADGSAFKLTTEKYLIGGGQDIDGIGITPDIEIPEEAEDQETDTEAGEETDAYLTAALDYLRAQAVPDSQDR